MPKAQHKSRSDRRPRRVPLALKIAILELSFVATAAGRAPAQTPQSVVEKYCSLDAQGANFTASNANAKLTSALLINEDEAAYDQSVIIKSYKVGKFTVGKSIADVEVIYTDLGIVGGESPAKKELRQNTSVPSHVC